MAHRLSNDLRDAGRTPSAFSGVYEAKARAILVFFVRRTFDVELARDLTAETFAQAFEHRRSFRGRTDAEASAWLYTIAARQLSRYVRKGVVQRKAVERLGIELPAVSCDEQQRIVATSARARRLRRRWAGTRAGRSAPARHELPVRARAGLPVGRPPALTACLERRPSGIRGAGRRAGPPLRR